MKKIKFLCIALSLVLLLSAAVIAPQAMSVSADDAVADYTFSTSNMTIADYKGSTKTQTYDDKSFFILDADSGSAKIGDYITLKLPNVKAGSYYLSTYNRDLKSRSTFDISINGVNNGITYNYSSNYTTWGKHDIGYIDVDKSGDVLIKFTISALSTNIDASYQPTGIFLGQIMLYSNDYADRLNLSVADYKSMMNLSWAEEFDEAELDRSVWNVQDVHRNSQLSFYNTTDTAGNQNENIQVVDGNLVLKVTKNQITCTHKGTMTEEEHKSKYYNHGFDYDYTAGGIDSRHKLEVSKGVIEARVKGPIGSGLWCSVWMCGIDPSLTDPNSPTSVGHSKWPWTGEIDIFEYLGKNPREEWSSLHYQDPSYPNYTDGQHNKSAGGKYYTLPNNGKFNTDYHTVGIIWTETQMSFYIDDYIYQTIDITAPEFYAFRDYDFFFLVTFPVGGSIAGDITADFPQSFSVDYIRHYRAYTPELESATANSITLKERNGYEYSMDGKTWQKSNVFTGLEENTEYKFYERIAISKTIANSETSEVSTFSTTSSQTSPPTTEPTTPSPEINYGDVNNDGKINAADVLLLRKYLSKWEVAINLDNADCNADGKVNAADVLLLRKYLAKWDVKLGK